MPRRGQEEGDAISLKDIARKHAGKADGEAKILAQITTAEGQNWRTAPRKKHWVVKSKDQIRRLQHDSVDPVAEVITLPGFDAGCEGATVFFHPGPSAVGCTQKVAGIDSVLRQRTPWRAFPRNALGLTRIHLSNVMR